MTTAAVVVLQPVCFCHMENQQIKKFQRIDNQTAVLLQTFLSRLLQLQFIFSFWMLGIYHHLPKLSGLVGDLFGHPCLFEQNFGSMHFHDLNLVSHSKSLQHPGGGPTEGEQGQVQLQGNQSNISLTSIDVLKLLRKYFCLNLRMRVKK